MGYILIAIKKHRIAVSLSIAIISNIYGQDLVLLMIILSLRLNMECKKPSLEFPSPCSVIV
jgi:hypothetical protein